MPYYDIYKRDSFVNEKHLGITGSSNILGAIMEHVGNREVIAHGGISDPILEKYQVVVKFNNTLYTYTGVLVNETSNK